MIRATLLTEGSSDQVLLPILRWLLGSMTSAPVTLQWADLRGLPRRPRTLAQKIALSQHIYPCDLLFVHRDRDRATVPERESEIRTAGEGVEHLVPVIPVQMQETWLLIDEQALRRAADKPTGSAPVKLPRPSRIEDIANPKAALHEALRSASQKTGRKAQRFRPNQAAHRLANIIQDWSPLNQLSAFQKLERDTRRALDALHAPPL